MILYTQIKQLYIYIMYAKIMKSKAGGTNMPAAFYDNVKIPIKTLRFGAESYDDYAVAPHDEDKTPDILKDT